MNKLFTAIVHKEKNLYVAECPEIGRIGRPAAARKRLIAAPEAVPGRILQVQLAVLLGFEIDDQAIVVLVLDDVGHVGQVVQRFAGDRIGRLNAIHIFSPFPVSQGPKL